jgi:hypothetical protein
MARPPPDGPAGPQGQAAGIEGEGQSDESFFGSFFSKKELLLLKQKKQKNFHSLEVRDGAALPRCGRRLSLSRDPERSSSQSA